MVMAGSWLMASVCTLRMTASSSTTLEVGQELRECGATLTVTSKGIHARSDWKTRLAGGHGGQALTLPDGFGQVLVKPLFHLGFVIIQIQLRGST